MSRLAWIILAVYLALSLVAQMSFATETKQTGAPGVDEELKFKEGDEAGNELKALKAEMLISSSDEKALSQLQKLLKKYRGTPLEPSLHFRLAEIYMRRARTATFFEVHRDDSSILKFTPGLAKSANSKKWIHLAIDTYDLLERRFPSFSDMDLVLFNNAFARQQLGDDKTAVVKYERVVKDFPESPLVPDAHLAIGEYRFGLKQFLMAFDEFELIRKFPDSRVFPYGLYKGAWALYNLNRTPEGLKQLEEIIQYSRNLGSNTEGKLDVSREALDDMVMFYEDSKAPEDAVAYFRKQGGDLKAGELVLKLGKLYQRHSRFKQLEIVFSDLVKSVPMAAERPQMHKDLMEGYEVTKNRNNVISHLEEVAGLCQETSSWSLAQKPEDREECWKSLEEAGKTYASKWHKELLSTGKPELVTLTRRAYEALLNNSRHITNEDKLRFEYAELLFQEKDYRKSALEYSKVAHLTVDAKFKHDAAYGAIVGLEKAVDDKWNDLDEKLFGQYATDYVTFNPKGQYLIDVKFKKAFIAYEKGRYDEVAPQFRDIAVHYSTTERGQKSAQLYLDVLNLQKKYELLRDEADFFAKTLKISDSLKAAFVKIHRESAFTVVQNLENTKQYDRASVAYSKMVNEDPKSPLADKALFNAIRCANLDGDLPHAITLSEQLLKNYPDSEHKTEITKALVTLYETEAQLGLAAHTQTRLAVLEPQNQWAHLLAAADYHALNNEWKEAEAIYSRIIQKALDTDEGRISLERLEAMAEGANDQKQVDKIMAQFITMKMQPQTSIAEAKFALRAFDEGSDEQTLKYVRILLDMKGEKNVSPWAMAQARFLQGRILEKEFDNTSIKARPERLSRVLAMKSERLDKTQKAYQEAIKYGDKKTALDSLIRLAGCYERFSNALNNIEPPKDASPDDKKKFAQEIENLALPISERNAETLQLALQQAKALKIHDDTVVRIQRELDRQSRKALKDRTVVTFDTPENVFPVVN